VIRVGITGGMGTGKSVIRDIFHTMNIPCYDADSKAKNIYVENKSVKQEVINLLGLNIINNKSGEIDLSLLKTIVFSDKNILKKIEEIVHPAIKFDYEQWCNKHESNPYTIKEAALMIESRSYKSLDYLILVTAPLSIRLERIHQRNGWGEDEIMKRIENQWSEEKKRLFADTIIVNDGSESILKVVNELHQKFINPQFEKNLWKNQ
jgi:dephospho-CoA kinase